MKHYILRDREVVEADNTTWSKYMTHSNRTISETYVGEDIISTVFLGYDYSAGAKDPIYFETLVIGGAMDGKMRRYSTRDEAESGHIAMVEMVSDVKSDLQNIGIIKKEDEVFSKGSRFLRPL